MKFNAKRIIKLEGEIAQLKESAKFKIKCYDLYLDGYDWFTRSSEYFKTVYKNRWYHWDDSYLQFLTDNLVNGILSCFQAGEHPYRINSVDVKNIDFTFLIEHYKTIKNHPESSKLIMLLESLDENNIELMRVILGVIE